MLKCIIYKVFFKRHGVEIAAFFRKVEILMTLQTVMENRFAKALQNEDNIFWKAYVKKRFQTTYSGQTDNKTISS